MEKNSNINPDSMIPMYKQIVNLLNEKIEKGELKPGDKLPSEAELMAVSYTHLRAHETDSYLVCRLLLEKKKKTKTKQKN